MKNLLDKILYKWIDIFCNHRHNLLMVYCVVMLFLMLGLISDSGTQYISYLLVYTSVFLLTYFLSEKLFNQSVFLNRIISTVISKIEVKKVEIFSIVILMATVLFMAVHFIYLGGVPTIRAWFSNDSFKIYEIRKSVTADSSELINYLSSFTLKAIIPFLLIFFYQKGNWKIFIPVFVVSLFYCLSLIAKSFVVTSFIPLLIFCFYKRHFFRFILFGLIIFGGLNFLMFIANPSLRSGDTNTKIVSDRIIDKGAGLESSMSNLLDRTFYIPGKTVSGWFETIPSQKPFLNGCGFRFIAPIKNCEYRNYSSELYELMYPEYAKLGYAGEVNVASFMYDYSNFGWIGIIYSAIILALIFVFINFLFLENNFIKLCINIFYVLMLSSSSFLTLLLSGGWALIIILFLIFRKGFVKTTT